MSEHDNLMAEGHEPHVKHLQLGVDPNSIEGDNRTYIEDKADRDALWADATTVEQFESDLQELRDEDPEILEQLRKLREDG